jgi:L-ribulose-5-phosphate 3-epimerase
MARRWSPVTVTYENPHGIPTTIRTVDRREFLGLSAATVALGTLTERTAAQTPATTGWKNHLDAYSRTLHWLRTPGEVAAACHEIGNTTIDLTVRAYPGHVLPESVKTDLPIFVNGLKRDGIVVTKIGMDVADANTPYVEAMLDTAASLGIHHTWWRGIGWDWSQPYQKMLDAMKPRVEPLARLLEKYKVKACYHPGGGFTEILDLCRAFDSRYIAIDYDTGNLGQFNQGALVNQIRIGGPYIGSFVFKDFVIERTDGARPGGAADAGRAGGAAAGRGGRGGGSPNGWSSRQVPVGTGVLNLPVICQALKEINFQGPIECQPEWPELGGPNQGRDAITIPREDVIRLLRRDYLTVSAPLAAAGVV